MKDTVHAKKWLGQHFLKNDDIARQIVHALTAPNRYVLEIGPGMGILTRFLLQHDEYDLSVVEIDEESVDYLKVHFPELASKIYAQDFLDLSLNDLYAAPISIIGNFPYNISSQILFKIIEYKDLTTQLVGMFQKEVAERVASKPGKKTYGILSVLLQAYFDIEYLFTVDEFEFSPPPKVKSAVIRVTRNPQKKLCCDEKLFTQVVKTAFNQRRKTLRNSLKTFHFKEEYTKDSIFGLRPEQLSVADFEMLTNNICLNS